MASVNGNGNSKKRRYMIPINITVILVCSLLLFL